MKLNEIASFLDCEVFGSSDIEVTGLSCDSRKIEKGTREGGMLFAAIPGEHVDGHSFVRQAVEAGARVVLAEKKTEGIGASQVIVPDIREALSRVSDIFYGEPSKRLTLIGVTGTNGKTTTTYILESIIKKAGFNPGVIGTINYRYNGKTIPAPHTTPQSPELHKILKEMADNGVTHCVMEVSSHSLEQKRVAHCRFASGIFTNLTHDHLDYHKTMDEYFRCKSVLFRHLEERGGAMVVNIDDSWGRILKEEFPSAITFSLKEDASVFPRQYSLLEGRTEAVVSTPGGDVAVSSHLVGEYNLQNILGAIGAAYSVGIGAQAISEGISSLERVPGRLEKLESKGDRSFRAYVDYAHTGDALERALLALRPVTSGRLITVFGCGGNRDRLKRPKMGEISARLSNLTIVTSDNPRDEEPLEIIREIEAGITLKKISCGDAPSEKGYMVVPDRKEAIKKAVSLASNGDTILVAGKGHEDYQIVKGVKSHFDDFEVLNEAIGELDAAGPAHR